jgi:hypothetical protein
MVRYSMERCEIMTVRTRMYSSVYVYIYIYMRDSHAGMSLPQSLASIIARTQCRALSAVALPLAAGPPEQAICPCGDPRLEAPHRVEGAGLAAAASTHRSASS